MTCEHIVTSDEGTSYCALAESAGPAPTGLLPAEDRALTVALAQVQQGKTPHPRAAAVCVLTLARLTGRYDWTTDTLAAIDQSITSLRETS